MSRQERRERAEARVVELGKMVLSLVADSVDEKTLTPQSLAEAINAAERLIFQGVRPQEAHVKPAVHALVMPKIYSMYIDILRRNHSEMEKLAAETLEGEGREQAC